LLVRLIRWNSFPCQPHMGQDFLRGVLARYYGANATSKISAPIFQGMSEIRTVVTTLRSKRDDIELSIRLYEGWIKQARADLAYISAEIKIFEVSGDPQEMGRYIDTHRLMKRGEPIDLCKEALASGPKSTRELALFVLESQGPRYRRQGAGESCGGSAYPFLGDAGFARADHEEREEGNASSLAAPDLIYDYESAIRKP
jgi:hypothetical protein